MNVILPHRDSDDGNEIAPTFPSWDDVILDPIDPTTSGPRRITIIAHLASVLMVLAGIGIIGIPLIGRCRTSLAQAQTIATAKQTAASWPKSHRDLLLDSARDYNKRLAASGQHVLGEVAAPFADGNDKTTATDDGDNSPQSSIAYQSLLDIGDGLMGTIRIPKISVDLPILHGTSEKALEQGAGHLYGTSLPIGGVSTHAVVTGHRGLVSALMFTRLDEIHAGDSFYIDMMGKEFGYRVDRISVIEPDDSRLLRITPGEDRVTLMTCTPYGVNTHRLLVSGVRARIPEDIPPSSDSPKDALTIAIITATAIGLPGTIACMACSRKKRRIISRHASERRH